MADTAELPDRTETLVVGAGVMGHAIAYHLATSGHDDVTVVDSGTVPVTGGSGSEVPTAVFQTSPSRIESAFARTTRELAIECGAYREHGSLEIATSADHLSVLDRRMDQAAGAGLDGATLLDPSSVSERLPMVEADRVLGGYHVPTDGSIATVEFLTALRERAEARGATFHGSTTVRDVTTTGGTVETVVTDRGEVGVETVVAAADVRTPSICELVGIDLPLVACVHQYGITEPVDTDDAADRQPLLRYPDEGVYARSQDGAIGIGNYANEARVVEPGAFDSYATAPLAGLGSKDDGAAATGAMAGPSSETQFSVDEFTPAHEAVAEVAPALREVDVAAGVDGLLAVTPDDNPVLGESPAVAGFWIAAGVRPMHAGGAGKALADRIRGAPSRTSFDPWHAARFQPHSGSPSFAREQGRDSYAGENGAPTVGGIESTGETLRESPFYRYQATLDAEFYDLRYGGWKRPMRFGTNEALLDAYDIPNRGMRDEGWSPVEAVEHLAVRDRVGMCDLTSFTTFDIVGSGAVEFGQRVFTNDVDLPVGGVTYTLMTNEAGGILGDMTVVRRGVDHLHVISNSGGAGTRQIARLQRLAADESAVHVSNAVGARCGVSVTGPRAREMLDPVVEADLDGDAFPFFSTAETYVGSVPVLAVRVSYVGELGWEFHTSMEYGAELWHILEEAGKPHGVVPFGDGALVSMRLEKGFPAYGVDIDPSYTPLEASMAHTVDFETEFIGRAAVLAQRDAGLDRRRTTLTLDDADAVVGSATPVLEGDTAIGHVTSAEEGYSVGEFVLSAYLPPAYTDPGTRVEIQYGNERYDATVRESALFDPERTRMVG